MHDNNNNKKSHATFRPATYYVANVGRPIEILLDLNVLFIIHMEFFLGILQDSRTSLNGTFAGMTIFFMISVLGPTVILKTG